MEARRVIHMYEEWKQPLIEAASLAADNLSKVNPNSMMAEAINTMFIPDAMDGDDGAFFGLYNFLQKQNHPFCLKFEAFLKLYPPASPPPSPPPDVPCPVVASTAPLPEVQCLEAAIPPAPEVQSLVAVDRPCRVAADRPGQAATDHPSPTAADLLSQAVNAPSQAMDTSTPQPNIPTFNKFGPLAGLSEEHLEVPGTPDDRQQAPAEVAHLPATPRHAAPKTLKVVVRGLPLAASSDFIKQELIELGFAVSKVDQLSTGRPKRPVPLFLLHILRSGNYKKIWNLVSLLGVPINIERSRKLARPRQCFNCQSFGGHIAANCDRPMRCRYCAGTHDSRSCIQRNVVKCCNCGGPHLSSSGHCPSRPKPPPPAPRRVRDRREVSSRPGLNKPPDDKELGDVLCVIELLHSLISSIFGDVSELKEKLISISHIESKPAKMLAVLELFKP